MSSSRTAIPRSFIAWSSVLLPAALLGGSAACEPKVAIVDEGVVCGERGERISKDEDVVRLEGCEIYRGSLGLEGITNRAALSSLRVVEGSVGAGGYNVLFENLDGLERLETVGELTFLGDGLRDLSGVRNLERVEGFLRLDDLPNLTRLDGLENLRVVGGRLSIRGNPALTSLAGLAALEKVEGDLYLRTNPLVPQSEIDALLDRIEVDGEVRRD